MTIVPVGEALLSEREVELVAREIVEAAEQHPDGFIEADGGGSTIVQLANLRIAIARPPFSDAIEVTAGGSMDVDGIKRFIDLGVDRIVIPPLGFDVETLKEQLGNFADNVIAKVG